MEGGCLVWIQWLLLSTQALVGPPLSEEYHQRNFYDVKTRQNVHVGAISNTNSSVAKKIISSARTYNKVCLLSRIITCLPYHLSSRHPHTELLSAKS